MVESDQAMVCAGRIGRVAVACRRQGRGSLRELALGRGHDGRAELDVERRAGRPALLLQSRLCGWNGCDLRARQRKRRHMKHRNRPGRPRLRVWGSDPERKRHDAVENTTGATAGDRGHQQSWMPGYRRLRI